MHTSDPLRTVSPHRDSPGITVVEMNMETLAFRHPLIRDDLGRGSTRPVDEVSKIFSHRKGVGANADPGRMSLGESDASPGLTQLETSFWLSPP